MAVVLDVEKFGSRRQGVNAIKADGWSLRWSVGGAVSKLCCLDRDLSKRVVKMGVWDSKKQYGYVGTHFVVFVGLFFFAVGDFFAIYINKKTDSGDTLIVTRYVFVDAFFLWQPWSLCNPRWLSMLKPCRLDRPKRKWGSWYGRPGDPWCGTTPLIFCMCVLNRYKNKASKKRINGWKRYTYIYIYI